MPAPSSSSDPAFRGTDFDGTSLENALTVARYIPYSMNPFIGSVNACNKVAMSLSSCDTESAPETRAIKADERTVRVRGDLHENFRVAPHYALLKLIALGMRLELQVAAEDLSAVISAFQDALLNFQPPAVAWAAACNTAEYVLSPLNRC